MKFFLPLLLAAASANSAGFGAKPYGVVLLGEGGSKEWQTTADDTIKMMGPERPTIFAEGEADHKEVQRAVDALNARRVEKIIGVPLFVSTFSDIMDQNRYLFGIREKPVKGSSAKRLKSKAPLVLAKGLDDHAVIVEILASRAAALTRDPGNEALVLVGQAPEAAEAASQWVATVQSLAQKVAQKAGMKSGQAMALRQNLRAEKRGKAENEVREAIKSLRKAGPVCVVPLELSPGLVRERLPKIMEGLLVRYDGRTILPDARIALWVQQTADAAAKLPDMRQFKSDSLAAPKGVKPEPFSKGVMKQ